MSIGPISVTDVPLRGRPPKGFTWQANELFDVFQPIIGANAFLVYVTLTRRSYANQALTYSTRELARVIGNSAATVHRALKEIEYIGMVRLKRARGSKRSECELVDLRQLARRLGAPQT